MKEQVQFTTLELIFAINIWHSASYYNILNSYGKATHCTSKRADLHHANRLSQLNAASGLQFIRLLVFCRVHKLHAQSIHLENDPRPHKIRGAWRLIYKTTPNTLGCHHLSGQLRDGSEHQKSLKLNSRSCELQFILLLVLLSCVQIACSINSLRKWSTSPQDQRGMKTNLQNHPEHSRLPSSFRSIGGWIGASKVTD
jgi:hypothetical protein